MREVTDQTDDPAPRRNAGPFGAVSTAGTWTHAATGPAECTCSRPCPAHSRQEAAAIRQSQATGPCVEQVLAALDQFFGTPGRQPFRCPVCEGCGRKPKDAQLHGYSSVPCHACSGTGVVWGPPR